VIAALARLVPGRSRTYRVVVLWIYRWCFLLAGASIAVGVAYERADRKGWDGAIVFLVLFGAISLAPLVAELGAVAQRTWSFVALRVRGPRSAGP
jgi:hypothetical protein